MKHFFLFLLIAATQQSTAQSNGISWNKIMTGIIGDYPATMYLQKTGTVVNGYYYYDNKQIPIKLTDTDSNKDSIHLTVYDDNNEENFEGTYTNNVFKGIWKKITDDKTTMLNFSFTENINTPEPHFDLVYTDYNTEYPVDVKADDIKPSYGYFAAALWPVAATPAPLSNFLKKWVNEEFGHKNSTDPIGTFFVTDKNKGVSEWKKELNAEKKDVIKADPSGFSRSTETRLLVMYQSEQYISVANCNYEFTGGAHGNGGTGCSVLDLKKMKVLNLNDIFTSAGKQKLASLLDEAVRAKFNIPKGTKLHVDKGGALLVDKIEPTNNFYITGKGIGFNYTPYEIAAYSYGETNLFIPFEKLKGLLQANFKY